MFSRAFLDESDERTAEVTALVRSRAVARVWEMGFFG